MDVFRARFRGVPSSVRDARRAVADYARLCGFSSAELHDIESAVGEALANAVEHGTRDLGTITITCAYQGTGLTIEIVDEGRGFDHTSSRRRDPRSVRGFGIGIMRSLMDDVRYKARGNVVVLFKAGPAAQSDAAFEQRA